MEVIRSRRNPLLLQTRQLLERPRERHAAGLAVMEGEHLLADWLAAGHRVEHLLLSASRAAEADAWQGRGATVQLVDDDCLASVSPAGAAPGVLAIVPIPDPQPSVSGSILALDGVQDPGNVGTAIRSAAASAFDQVWLGRGCADAWSWKVLRAGQGAHAILPVCQGIDLQAALHAYTGQVLALVPAGGTPLHRTDLRGDIVLLLGGEGAGIGAEGLRAADRLVSIPMPGRTESLNVAVAAAIAMYERVRQSSDSA